MAMNLVCGSSFGPPRRCHFNIRTVKRGGCLINFPEENWSDRENGIFRESVVGFEKRYRLPTVRRLIMYEAILGAKQDGILTGLVRTRSVGIGKYRKPWKTLSGRRFSKVDAKVLRNKVSRFSD